MPRATPAPRSEALGVSPRRRLDDAGYDAKAVSDYTTEPPISISQIDCPRLVTWLRCRGCSAGFFAAGAPSPQSCSVCTGGRLQPVGSWNLAHEAAPAGLLRRGEVKHAVLG
jgi:hypothetical protein